VGKMEIDMERRGSIENTRRIERERQNNALLDTIDQPPPLSSLPPPSSLLPHPDKKDLP